MKTAQIPAKADPVKQEEFLKNQLEPHIQRAKKKKEILLFLDASHFVWQLYLGVLWCLKRLFVPAASGRQRINVLGALDPITKELTTIINRTYITSTTVCEMLKKLIEKYRGQPLTIVLGNARYQHCKLVQDTAAALHITLLFLPTYSPNLNLIERLWRFVKKDCLYSKYYETADDFSAAIETSLSQIRTTKKKQIDSLITFNFQLFKEKPGVKPAAA